YNLLPRLLVGYAAMRLYWHTQSALRETLLMKAAVLYEYQKPLVVEEVELDDPKAGEVLVRTAASGVCHSDYHIVKGEWTPPLPMVLGHEAAGVVEAVGPGVTSPRVGDHVIISFRPQCGQCF